MAKTRVTLVGCGRIGLTIAHGIKAAMKDIEVVGHDKERDVARLALGAKAIDKEVTRTRNLMALLDCPAAGRIGLPPTSVTTPLKVWFG